MLTEMTISGALLTVLRGQPFPVRGRVDEEFIRQAVAHFVVKDTYQVIAPRIYPEKYEEIACGTRAVGLEQALRGFLGRTVWIGEEQQITALDDAVPGDFERFLYMRKA
jgi:hypothetical protein